MKLFAAVAVCACVSTAFADFQYASTVSDQGPDVNVAITNAANMQGPVDGTTVSLAYSSGTGVTGTGILRVYFANPVDNPSFTLYGVALDDQTGNVVATLTAVVWYTAGGVPTTGTAAPNVSFASSTPQDYFIPVDAGALGTFAPGTMDHVDLTFTFTGGVAQNSVGTLTIDAISNPEPGTLGLFAVGAAGLGLLGLRRRRRARAASR